MPMVSAKDSFKFSKLDFDKVVAVSVDLKNEDMTVVAYEDSRTPSVIITDRKFPEDTSMMQQIGFKKIEFRGFEGYRVWCCEIDGNEMRVCLVR